MLTTTELTQLREVQEAFMRQRVAIWRKETPATRGEEPQLKRKYRDVPARITAELTEAREVAERMPQAVVRYVIRLPYGTDVRVDDEVRDAADVRYVIRGVQSPGTNETAAKCVAERIT